MAVITGGAPLDPLGDGERLAEAGQAKNYAKVGTSRPGSLLYTYGPGSVLDLPHFTVLPAGLDAWDRVWARRPSAASIKAPRLLAYVRRALGRQVEELRPFPHQPSSNPFLDEGRDLGVPAYVFPQWFRCTGCDLLAPLSTFTYFNTNPRRPDEARFEHTSCPGRPRQGGGQGRGSRKAATTPARYLLACTNGHLDEFPYDGWVHQGGTCQVDVPILSMEEGTASRGSSSTIRCRSCGARRGMNEAQGDAGREKLPSCRGRHPHLDSYTSGCTGKIHLMLIGASNMWFPVLQSEIVMPQDLGEKADSLGEQLVATLGEDKLRKYANDMETLRDVADGKVALRAYDDEELAAVVAKALAGPASDTEDATWSRTDLLAPEWQWLQRDPQGPHHHEPDSQLQVTLQTVGESMPGGVSRVVAVEKMRKVNALLGFTRIDDLDRLLDPVSRIVPLSVLEPRWVVATEDRGEGVLLQLEEERVEAWEARVLGSQVWAAHRLANERNFVTRQSETATAVDAAARLKPPRYWLAHTLAHLLIREMAMSSGYGAASISERIYAWDAESGQPAAGMLLMTTSSDSDGTLGGLVRLSEPDRLAGLVTRSLSRAMRCSSDPICSRRTAKDPEDFLHGAACHCCTMASETSCERANRFLDRRFVVPLRGFEDLAFFADPRLS